MVTEALALCTSISLSLLHTSLAPYYLSEILRVQRPIFIIMPPPGFKRSRALWDEARRSRQTKSEQVNSWVRVALYEIQPIRFNQINTQGIQSIASWVVQSLWTCVVRTPSWVRGFCSFLKRRTVQQWVVVAGVFAYYWFVRWMHE